MKKLLGIVVLGLLWSNIGYSDVETVLKQIKSNKDIAQGFNKVKEFEKRNKWRVTNRKILESNKNTRKHVVKIVKKSEGYPVRFGEESLRFEVRAGDGWGWDARNDRERVELLICCINKGTTWNAWSIYYPNDFKVIFPAKAMMAQFHNDGDLPPGFTFENQSDRFTKDGGGYWIEVDEYIGGNNIPKKLLDKSEVLGKWTDVLVNAKWTNKKNDGFFKIWINGKLVFDYKGMTQQNKSERIEYHIGIYRSFLSRSPGPDPTQIVFYDEIRFAKSCKKLKLKDLGYSCKEIENQIVK